MLRNRAHAKFGLARTCFENAVLGGVGQIEKFLARQARVEVFESWDDPGNCVSDQVVIVRQTQPVGIRPRSQRGVRQIGNDRYVAHQLRGSRRKKTFEGSIMPIESSTVRNCLPDSCRSASLRPRHGRINARSPVIRCERFNLVETCTVSLQRCMACALYTVSGTLERKLPLMAKNTFTSPSNIACNASTAS